LLQLLNQPLLPLDLALFYERSKEEAEPSRPPKQSRVKQRWHMNLQPNARALVILLQIGCIELGNREMAFEGCFEGLNNDQYFCMVEPIKGSCDHQ